MTTPDALNSVAQTLPESALKKVLKYAEELRKSDADNPFKPKTEEEFFASVDRGIADIEAGRYLEADAAVKAY